MHPTIELTQQLIRCPSLTPDDAGCHTILINRLTQAGFLCQQINRGKVNNIWATLGPQPPALILAGHTDVVPPNNIDNWQHPPFCGDIINGELWGRGAQDMKGGLSALIVAAEHFAHHYLADQKQGVAFIITSDEEGPAIDGTVAVVDWMRENNIYPKWGIVAEPSSKKVLGDTIKNGRRGSLTCVLKVFGKQGHVAYPHLAENPIHEIAPLLAQLSQHTFDQGNTDFPPSTLQIVRVEADSGAGNVIPGDIEIQFNIRFNTTWCFSSLENKLIALFEKYLKHYEVFWERGSAPFLTQQGHLTKVVSDAIESVCDITPQCSTDGGTSDGRFLAQLDMQVIELGGLNQFIHQIDERVKTQELVHLTEIYQLIFKKLLCEEEN